ncbi:MAG: hypothetical protein HUU18_10870 [Phycisphaerales bacterium]|nr:hypothetical protein [Phycisphaerales bacterium]
MTRNSRLRGALESLRAEGVEVRLPAPEDCMDNAAMIAGLGGELLRLGAASDLMLQAEPTVTS